MLARAPKLVAAQRSGVVAAIVKLLKPSVTKTINVAIIEIFFNLFIINILKNKVKNYDIAIVHLNYIFTRDLFII